jgi:hypothetical protein
MAHLSIVGRLVRQQSDREAARAARNGASSADPTRIVEESIMSVVDSPRIVSREEWLEAAG